MAVPTILRWWWWKCRPVGGGALRNAGDDKPEARTMAKLILQFEDQVVKEYPVGMMATIGRLSDNTVMIDNPAVSSHHACVFRDGGQFVVEDQRSGIELDWHRERRASVFGQRRAHRRNGGDRGDLRTPPRDNRPPADASGEDGEQ